MRVFRINTSKIYNAENRPVRWERGDTVIMMDFDRMGRRVFYKEEVAGGVAKYHRFVYDNHLCIQKLDVLNNNLQINLFVWDPNEATTTLPLFMLANPGNYKFFYTFDGNKNVSELVHFETRNGIAAHYDYAPFGAVTRSVSASTITDNTFTSDNPFRFSSEYHDDTLGLVYYNYRHYNPIDGRWISRDLVEETYLSSSMNLFFYVKNAPLDKFDLIGLSEVDWTGYKVLDMPPEWAKSGMGAYTLLSSWRNKELKSVDATCSRVENCFRCICSGKSVYFYVEIDHDESWVLKSELNNSSLRQHEKNIFNIAHRLAQEYSLKLRDVKGVGINKIETKARDNACKAAEYEIIQIQGELDAKIEKETNKYEFDTNFGIDEDVYNF